MEKRKSIRLFIRLCRAKSREFPCDTNEFFSCYRRHATAAEVAMAIYTTDLKGVFVLRGQGKGQTYTIFGSVVWSCAAVWYIYGKHNANARQREGRKV